MRARGKIIYILVLAIAGFAGGFVAETYTNGAAIAELNDGIITTKGIHLVDPRGTKRAGFYFESAYRPVFYIAGFDGTKLSTWKIDKNKDPSFDFYDTNGLPLWSFTVKNGLKPTMNILNTAGNTVAQLTSLYGYPVLVFRNKEGLPALMLGLTSGNPFIRLIGNDGKGKGEFIYDASKESTQLTLTSEKGTSKVSLVTKGEDSSYICLSNPGTQNELKCLSGSTPPK